jgi:four helix bundle protein
MKDFKKLKIWQRSHQLALDIYRASKIFPAEEIYGLTRQMRNASTSIPTNIAEGCGRGSEAELARFCQIAMGSASELEYHLLLAKDLGLIKESKFDLLNQEVIEVKMMLTAFIKRLKADR